jgi:hypothetical protein
MKRVYGSDDRMLVGHLHEMLEAHGIASMVRNDYLGGGAGELPPNECWPELWVVETADWERAKALVETQLGPIMTTPWTCPGCGETIEGQFAQCWHCGHKAPEEA